MADANDDGSRRRDGGSDWESGIDGPAGENEVSTGRWSGSESRGPETLREPSSDRATTHSGRTPGTAGREPELEVPDPAALPPETDPTGAGWWRVLAVLTGVAVAGFFLWPLLSPVLSLAEVAAGTRVETAGALLALAPLLLLVLVRFVALPVALWRDATLLRRTEVDWEPSRGFYMTAGALWASLTCAYYLYKRSRYTGRPSLPIPAERLHFAGRRIESNWHLVVALALLVGPLAVGFDALFVAVGSVPGGDVIGAILALVFLLLLFVAFVLLPVAFYRDCRAVRRTDADWQPTTWFYVVVGYLFTLPVGAYYLYKRSQIESL
jgi:hypothetical protein